MENPSRTIVLILDNAKTHHAKVTTAECEKLDIRLVHLPPYSPDLNPIEFAWKDGKKELIMQDFDGIVEKARCTLTDMMKEKKMGYSIGVDGKVCHNAQRLMNIDYKTMLFIVLPPHLYLFLIHRITNFFFSVLISF